MRVNYLLSKRRFDQAGQSLIEVTFATAVVSLVLVAILSTVIQSVQNSRVSLEQTRATQYAQEVLEWTRSQRDNVGWGVFYSALVNRGSVVTYCLPSMPVDYATLLAQSPGPCNEEQKMSDSQFQRVMRITVLSPTQVEIVAEVTRPGRTGMITTSLDTILTDWEQ